jgi:hypothetical protein
MGSDAAAAKRGQYADVGHIAKTVESRVSSITFSSTIRPAAKPAKTPPASAAKMAAVARRLGEHLDKIRVGSLLARQVGIVQTALLFVQFDDRGAERMPVGWQGDANAHRGQVTAIVTLAFL